ncbi:MAG: hypothetical protein E6G51_09955 [Actinobacteria bacterium]|nr:MAG: hypothetical protein E6G51_09955 [Actinomycetota bacterium]
MIPPRENWTDPRLDEFAKRIDERFDDIDRRFDSQQKNMDARFNALERTMQIVFSVLGAVLAANTAMLLGLIGWIVTQS